MTGERNFSVSIRLKPQSLEAENNLGVANFSRKRYEIAIDDFVAAARIEDSKQVAQNLVTALALAPPELRTLPKMRPTLEAANLLQSKYDISGPMPDYAFWLLPPPIPSGRSGPEPGPGPEAGQPGWSGTGIIISDSGLILTNRHVAKGSKTLWVTLSDGTHSSAEIVAIDDQYDLALIRLSKPNRKIPFVRLSPENSPAEGADCVVMGFPMIDQLGAD